MSALGLLHALLVGTLLTGAAALIETVLRWHGRPARFVWGAALGLTLTAPLWGPALAPASERGGRLDAWLTDATVGAPAQVSEISPAAAPSWRARLSEPHPWLGFVWALSGVAALLLVGGGIASLQRRVGRWPRGRVHGEPVVLSPDFGPASVGLVTPRTVLPLWTLDLEPSELDVVLRHERAHAEAKDPLLLALGLAAVATAPWNPAAWWQVVRLRRAVELDCDRRVLASGAAASEYGRVLVALGRRLGRSALPAPALIETTSFLERRLTHMRTPTRPSWRKTGFVLLAAGGLLTLACEAPAPTDPQAEEMTVFESALTASDADLLARFIGSVSTRMRVVVDGVLLAEGLQSPILDELAPEMVVSVEILRGEAIKVDPDGDPVSAVVSIRTTRAEKSGDTKLLPILKRDQEKSPFTVEQVTRDEPLIIVDGVITDKALADVEELDIESIEIVKGPQALALYGERGRNGIIQIKTKGGGAPR